MMESDKYLKEIDAKLSKFEFRILQQLIHSDLSHVLWRFLLSKLKLIKHVPLKSWLGFLPHLANYVFYHLGPVELETKPIQPALVQRLYQAKKGVFQH